MKPLCRLLLLNLALLFSLASGAQSEAVKKELADADIKYQYGKKFEDARPLYLKHQAYLTAQQQANLGVSYYFDPTRGSESYAEGMKWLTKAAGLGNTEAMRNLVSVYESGLGVPKDSVKQGEWILKAAHLGDPLALLQAGYYHQKGRVLPLDTKKAWEFYQQALAKGNDQAGYFLGMMSKDAQNLPDMIRYFQQSANAGYGPAQFELAETYEKGNGVVKDVDEAIRWYKKIQNNTENRQFYTKANSIIRAYGQQEPPSDLPTVKPKLEKLVSAVNQGFYGIKGKTISPRDDKSQYDNIGSSKNEYYTALTDLGFKNGYLRKNNFTQVQKNNAHKQVEFYSYRGDIVHSVSAETSYKVYLQWVGLIKSTFPDWQSGDESNQPEYKRGKIRFWRDFPGGRRTVIEIKTCCPTGMVQIEIESMQLAQ